MGPNHRAVFAAEFIGTFAIVFFGVGSVAVGGGSLGLVGISLTFGLIVGAMVASLGHVSGAHINPSVTFVMLVTRRIKPPMAGLYVLAQLSGAIAAAYLLRGVVAEDQWSSVALGTTTVAEGMSATQGLVVEFVLTFFLVLVIFGAAVDPRGAKLGPLAIGGVVCLLILMGGPLTGASMNPARTLGPALASGTWENHWVYWVGPLLGAVAAAMVYEKVIAPADAGSED